MYLRQKVYNNNLQYTKQKQRAIRSYDHIFGLRKQIKTLSERRTISVKIIASLKRVSAIAIGVSITC